MQPGKPNVGLKMHADAVGEHLALLEASDPKLVGGVLDPAAFSEDGGPSISQRINGELIKKKLVPFRPADNKRVPGRGAMGGWDQVRARLEGDEDGLPMMVVFNTCTHLIRTLPSLHAPDEARYACMSRPWIRKPAVNENKSVSGYRPVTRQAASGNFKVY
jgi:hypothetical protein